MEKLSSILKAQVSTYIDTDKLIAKLDNTKVIPMFEELIYVAFSETANTIMQGIAHAKIEAS